MNCHRKDMRSKKTLKITEKTKWNEKKEQRREIFFFFVKEKFNKPGLV